MRDDFSYQLMSTTPSKKTNFKDFISSIKQSLTTAPPEPPPRCRSSLNFKENFLTKKLTSSLENLKTPPLIPPKPSHMIRDDLESSRKIRTAKWCEAHSEIFKPSVPPRAPIRTRENSFDSGDFAFVDCDKRFSFVERINLDEDLPKNLCFPDEL